jgi:hypothetical protein
MTRYVRALEQDARLCSTFMKVVDGNLSPWMRDSEWCG